MVLERSFLSLVVPTSLRTDTSFKNSKCLGVHMPLIFLYGGSGAGLEYSHFWPSLAQLFTPNHFDLCFLIAKMIHLSKSKKKVSWSKAICNNQNVFAPATVSRDWLRKEAEIQESGRWSAWLILFICCRREQRKKPSSDEYWPSGILSYPICMHKLN